MSDPFVSPVNQQHPLAASAPSASNPTTAGAAASMNTPVVSSKTKINSLADLKKKAPKVYNQMMLSIQEMVRRDLQRHQQNLKKALRDTR